jgi:ribosomal protein L11 methyltransferase
MCLQWLDGLDLQGKTVIDFGCGSGILAIAALKLGAAKAIGIDIDPQAIQASRDNAERNGVSERLELYLPQDQPEAMKADVVVANILAGPLRELAPLISVLPVQAACWAFPAFWPARRKASVKPIADLFASTRWWRKKSGAGSPAGKSKRNAACGRIFVSSSHQIMPEMRGRSHYRVLF